MAIMAQEWADEIAKLNVPYGLIIAEMMWGFQEVERGRHPDRVLREVIARVGNRHADNLAAERRTIDLAADGGADRLHPDDTLPRCLRGTS